MYEIIHGSTQGLSDVEAFIDALTALDRSPTPQARGLFDPNGEIVLTRAPGRLDVMGGIADYSGSLVLELPIREATLVGLQRDASCGLRIVSLGAEDNNRAAAFEMPMADFERGGAPVDYAAARAYFRRDPARQWAAYAAGVFLALMRERGARFSGGARMLISSSVPEGKGVSSSAAIEVAVMQAVAAAFDIAIEPREMALLCQKVENLVVGAPCGVMDQITSMCGRAGQLLPLLCQPAEIRGTLAVPEDVAVWGLDSGERHCVGGADYTSVRIGAFMGYRMIAELAGLAVEEGEPGDPVRVTDPNWHGYLCNVTPDEFERLYAPKLPERMESAMFIAQYAGTTDAVTRIVPGESYPILAPTKHAVYEHARVQAFAESLAGAGVGPHRCDDRWFERLGDLMYRSHASYSACGLGSPGTDRFVELVRTAGPAAGLYGAKITGGGSGGTVAVLGRRGAAAEAAIRSIAEQYARETGRRPYVFAGSSPGAAAFGHLRLRFVEAF
jgi:galactokinase